MIGNGHEFSHGRQFAAWVGLVPGKYCLRSLLVMGARAVLNAARSKTAKVRKRQPLGDSA